MAAPMTGVNAYGIPKIPKAKVAKKPSKDTPTQWVLLAWATGRLDLAEVKRNAKRMPKGFSGALEVARVARKDDAESLQVPFCRLVRYHAGVYYLNDFPRNMDARDPVVQNALIDVLIDTSRQVKAEIQERGYEV